MKIKAAVVSSCLVGAVVLLAGYEYGLAQPEATQLAVKIAVVNVREVFRDCKSNARYRQEAMAEYNRTMMDLERLSKEIGADEAGLKTLKPGSPDHLKQYEEVLRKKAELDYRRQYHKQQRALKDQLQTEELYQEILQITKELAEQKGLHLVFDKYEPEFPAASGEELMAMLSANKLLYSGGCVDITGEVTTRLDAKEGAQP